MERSILSFFGLGSTFNFNKLSSPINRNASSRVKNRLSGPSLSSIINLQRAINHSLVFGSFNYAASANSTAVSSALIFRFLFAPNHADCKRVSCERPISWSVRYVTALNACHQEPSANLAPG